MNQPSLYTDRLSVFPDEQVMLHISAAESPCTLRVSRLGADCQQVMLQTDLITQDYGVPIDASSNGCNWPVHSVFDIPSDWASGYYELELTDEKGAKAHHFLVVKARGKKNNAALVLATNTYQAYNYWGGYNSYANVGGLMSGELDLPAASQQAIGRLSLQRPFPETLINPPAEIPRLVNGRKRALNEQPFAIDPAMMAQTEFSPFDGSAGFVNKWEHKFVAWAEQKDIALDYLIDADLESADAVTDYQTIIVVGHSEYWSAAQRKTVDSFVERGGNLCIFSGNTSYWKVRWEDDNQTMVAHKWQGELNDPLWADEETRSQATHLWSHPVFGQSESQTIGLSFLYGGYHRFGNCAARGQAGFTVYDEQHWSLKDSDLFYGDVFADEVPLIGYENDGCPLQFDENGRIGVRAGAGFPENLEIIAIAPVAMCEAAHSSYAPVLPPERLDVISMIKSGDASEQNMDQARLGHAVIAGFSKGKGYVFNTGTTEWVHGLDANDPFVSKITENVLRRFNVM